jgi:hypothetical protein
MLSQTETFGYCSINLKQHKTLCIQQTFLGQTNICVLDKSLSFVEKNAITETLPYPEKFLILANNSAV